MKVNKLLFFFVFYGITVSPIGQDGHQVDALCHPPKKTAHHEDAQLELVQSCELFGQHCHEVYWLRPEN